MIYSSRDGHFWQAEVFPDTGFSGFRCIAANDEHLVVAGASGIVRSDLRHPLRRPAAIAYGNNRFAAVGSSGRMIVSMDGIYWEEPVSPAVEFLWDITFAGNRFVAVGSHGAIVTSADGESWSRRESGTDRFLKGVAHGNGRFVVVGGDRILRFSDDAEEWSQGIVSNPGPFSLSDSAAEAWRAWSLHGVAFGGGTFVAVGHDGAILKSADGENWAVASGNRVDRLNSIAYGNGRFVAVGMNGLVLISSTGDQWMRYPLESPVDLSRVRFLDGTFVAAGWQGEVLFSRDGENWMVESTPTSQRLTDVASAEGKLVTIGLNGEVFHSSALPTIHQQPIDLTVAVREPFSFSVSATSGAVPSYQWHRNGEPVPGATAPSFGSNQAEFADEGLYQVAIDDGARTIWAMPARLVVEGDYLDWLADTSYTPEQLEQPEFAAPASDPGGYGIPNLARYGFGLDPHAPNPLGLPRLETRPTREYGQTGEKWVLKVPHLRTAHDLRFSVERSFNLTAWETWPLEFFEIVREGDHSLLIVKPSAVPPSAPAAFLRFQVEPQ